MGGFGAFSKAEKCLGSFLVLLLIHGSRKAVVALSKEEDEVSPERGRFLFLDASQMPSVMVGVLNLCRAI